MERVRIKLIKNADSINVVSNEEGYYAKGISSRKLEGEEYEYAYLDQNDIQVLAKCVAKEFKKNKKKHSNSIKKS